MKAKSPFAILNKKRQRQTVGDWKQFLAIVMMGAIAMTLFVGLLSNAQSLRERVDAFYASGDLPHSWVVTSSYDEEDEAFVRSQLEEGDILDKRFEVTARLNNSSSYCVVAPSMPTLSHPIEIFEQSPSQTNDEFFLVDYAFWAGNGKSTGTAIEVGQEVPVSFQLGSYLDFGETYLSLMDRYVKPGGVALHRQDEITISPAVTGIMTFPENIRVASYYPSTFLMSSKTFYDAFDHLLEENYTQTGLTLLRAYFGEDFPPMNEYLVYFKNPARIDSFDQNVRQYFEAKGEENNLVEILDRELNPWSIAVETEIQEATQLTFVFPFVFFFVALLVILTTISQIIIKERTQIGTMKALGLSNREIYWHYLSMVFSLSTLSSIIGFIAGPLLIPFIMSQKYNILYTLPVRNIFVFPWWQALLSYAVFIGLALLVGYFSCRKEVKLSPVDSMRASPVHYRGLRNKSQKEVRSAKFLSLKMAFRNIFVSKYKSIMVAIGVMGCTALLLCGFGIDNTLDHCIANDMALFYDTDLVCSYSLHQTDDQPAFATNPYVKEYDQYFSASVKASTDETSMSTSLRLISETHPYFHLDYPKGTVAISQKLQEELHLGVGDDIRFNYNGTILTRKIGQVYEAFMVHGITGYFSDFPEIEKAYTGVWINASEGVTLEQLKEAVLASMGNKIDTAKTRQDTRDTIASVMSGISLMTMAVKGFAIALALVVLYNLALLNYRERTRDIATMKVLGFTKGEIALSLIFETLTLTLVGVLLGFTVGYGFMYLVLYVNRVALVEFLYFMEPITYLIAFGLTFVVSLIVNVYLSLLTGKVKMVESLKSVE